MTCLANTLPIELLTDIFSRVLHASDYDRSGCCRHSPLNSILLVSKYWNYAATGDPRLWTFVYLRPTRTLVRASREEQLDISRTLVSRSKNLPLRAHIRAEPSERLALEASFKSLQGSFGRIEHLVVSAGGGIGQAVTQDAFENMPSLRSLRLANMQFVQWTFCSWDKLEELDIKQTAMWSLAEFHGFMGGLQERVKLKRLRLSFSPEEEHMEFYPGSPETIARWTKIKPPPMYLPRLRYLTLSYVPAWTLETFFNALDARHLHDIMVTARTDDPSYEPRFEDHFTFPRLRTIDLLAHNHGLCDFFSSISSTSQNPQTVKLFGNSEELTKDKRAWYSLDWVDRW